jgi:proteasome accessory factor B
MSTSKTERLLDLTMALLASKGYLSKEKIFEQIPGYEGELSAKERMFERDKDDLRNMGIEIDVGSNDPLFDDELGYRIDPKVYYLDIPDLEPKELLYLNLIDRIFASSENFKNLGGAVNKIAALGYELQEMPALDLPVENESLIKRVETLTTAILQEKWVNFSYWTQESQLRKIFPRKIVFQWQDWYLIGQENNSLKTFRLTRILSEIAIDTKAQKPSLLDLDETSSIYQAKISVKSDRCHLLRANASSIVEGAKGEDKLEINFDSEEAALRDLLWSLPDAKPISPPSLVARYQAAVRRLADG